jgi:IrrE N-terminal-like domain
MTMIHPSPETLAGEFWDGTGIHNTFPRKIEQAIAFKLPLALVGLSPLTMGAIGHWLQQRDSAIRLPDDRRDLCGCLVAFGGRGFIFVCDADSPEEQRLTMAHETAHFLVDYLRPRRQVLDELGEGITEVLDGIRPATPAERAAAILSRLHLGPHIHVLPRQGRDQDSDVAVAHAEDRADRLALELVAPQARVRAVLDALSARQALTAEAARATLATHFGLPAYAFHDTIQHTFRRPPTSFVADIAAGLRRRR